MKRTIAVVIGVALGASVAVAMLAVAGRTAPAVPSIGPVMPEDTGEGEMLLLVVGGVYPTREEAVAANATMSFGDVQGYYVVPVAEFEGLRDQLGAPGDWALVSAFRTEEGAREFAALAQQAFGVPAEIVPSRVRSLGGVYAGLGQEANPDGSGPLLGPIPASLPTWTPTPPIATPTSPIGTP